jgi:hypothetical protein
MNIFPLLPIKYIDVNTRKNLLSSFVNNITKGIFFRIFLLIKERL